MKKNPEVWWSKVCGLYAERKMSHRLFRKLQSQYEFLTRKDKK